MELYIQEEQISVHLQKRLERFRADYPVADEVKRRVSKPDMPFFGKETVSYTHLDVYKRQIMLYLILKFMA